MTTCDGDKDARWRRRRKIGTTRTAMARGTMTRRRNRATSQRSRQTRGSGTTILRSLGSASKVWRQ
eukprot:5876746-Pyramimonas_sp.AAC.1